MSFLSTVFSSQSREALGKLVVTFPAFAYDFANKKMFGKEEGLYKYIFYPGEEEERALLLVHGRNGNAVDFDPLIANLRSENFGRSIYVATLGDNGHTSVAEDAQSVAEVVQKIFTESNPPQILDMVGHSKGGIVVHYFRDKLSQNTSGTIGKVITVASPHGGTFLTRLVGGQVDKDLGEDSSLLQDLAQCHDEENYYYIGNTLDHLVSDKSAIPPNVREARTLRVTDYRGHTLLGSKEVASQIFKWLYE